MQYAIACQIAQLTTADDRPQTTAGHPERSDDSERNEVESKGCRAVEGSAVGRRLSAVANWLCRLRLFRNIVHRDGGHGPDVERQGFGMETAADRDQLAENDVLFQSA